MPAPRLLDKRTVNQELALEKKNQIEKGIALAQKVDAVKESLGKEEERLRTFREQSIARAQIEIDAKIKERDYLTEGNRQLQEERVRLSAPIDLSQAWNEVRTGKIELTEWSERLMNQSIELLAKEEDARQRSEQLAKEAKEIGRKDTLAERTLLTAETKYLEADDVLNKATADANKLLQEAKAKDKESRIREEDAALWEKSLSKREREVASHEEDLASREKKLKSRQELFMKAQRYLEAKH